MFFVSYFREKIRKNLDFQKFELPKEIHCNHISAENSEIVKLVIKDSELTFIM